MNQQQLPGAVARGLQLVGLGVTIAGIGNLLAPLLLLASGASGPASLSPLAMMMLALPIVANVGVLMAGLGLLSLARELGRSQRLP